MAEQDMNKDMPMEESMPMPMGEKYANATRRC